MDSHITNDPLASSANVRANVADPVAAVPAGQTPRSYELFDDEIAVVEAYRGAKIVAKAFGIPPAEIRTEIQIPRRRFEEEMRLAYKGKKGWEALCAMTLKKPIKQFKGSMAQDYVSVDNLPPLRTLDATDLKGPFTKGWLHEEDQLVIEGFRQGKTALQVALELTGAFPKRKRTESNVAFRHRKLAKDGKLVQPVAELEQSVSASDESETGLTTAPETQPAKSDAEAATVERTVSEASRPTQENEMATPTDAGTPESAVQIAFGR